MNIVLTNTDFERLASLDESQLLRLYDFLITRLRDSAGKHTVVTARVPLPVLERIKVLGYRRRMNRSEILRLALIEFLQRNPA